MINRVIDEMSNIHQIRAVIQLFHAKQRQQRGFPKNSVILHG